MNYRMGCQRADSVGSKHGGFRRIIHDLPERIQTQFDDCMVGGTKMHSNMNTILLPHDVIWPNRRRRYPTRKQRRRRRECCVGMLVFVLAVLLQVIDGLCLYHHDLPGGKRRQRLERQHGSVFCDKNLFTIMMMSDSEDPVGDGSNSDDDYKEKLLRRVTQLEELVAKQAVEIQRLKRTCNSFSDSLEAFTQMIQILKEAGLQLDKTGNKVEKMDEENSEGKESSSSNQSSNSNSKTVVESFDDAMIFGTAPSSVIDAADAAGAAILAAMLGGKQRMLVDVRDAELSTDSDTLVQFIELAILPIAAGLEGLKSTRNRLKIVFPKVSQLLEYRRTMALAAPEVVALSTLGFEPVEKRDKLVVLIAPAPDDEEGLAAMNEMLFPSDPDSKPIQQPIVLFDHHMVPIANQFTRGEFEKVYHLRLLSVQYMSGDDADGYFQRFQGDDQQNVAELSPSEQAKSDNEDEELELGIDNDGLDEETESDGDEDDDSEESIPYDDEALEAAMKHAHEVGTNLGVTRAMVIRAYPRPWHVFVDVSPDTDAAFEVAAIFDEEPTAEELNFAIVECLEGSEREDELVTQQMQQALEDGQLENVSNMIGQALGIYDDEDEDESDDDEDDEDKDDFDMYDEDSV